MFILGDFNSRSKYDNEVVRKYLKERNLGALLRGDELNEQFRKSQNFKLEHFRPEDKERMFLRFCQNFQEACINFQPTYKYDKRSHLFDTSKKKRVPSWCDRILWRKSHFVQSLHYNALPQINFSDHRPVIAIFKVKAVLDPEFKVGLS